jgi:DNA-binding SARP family transcriptional activator
MTVADPEKTVETMSKAEITDIFRQVGAHMKQQGEILVAVQQELSALKESGGTPAVNLDVPENPPPAAVNLEELSREQFGDYLLDKVNRESLTPVREAMKKDWASRTRSDLEVQVHTAAADHPDFNKWHEEIKTLTATHPTMNVEEAYQLAVATNADKASGIQTELKKAEDTAAAEKAKEPAEVVRPVFGGLLPTSGITADKEDGEMDSKDAADAAWDATQMSEHLKAVSTD